VTGFDQAFGKPAMTAQELIAEGRRLARRTKLLRSDGQGDVAAVYYGRNEDEIESSGYRAWLTIDSRHIPEFPPQAQRYLTIFTDEEECKGGRIEVSASWPQRTGTTLFAHEASVLPPIDAIFARGSEAVERWIRSFGWDRGERYNDNFGGRNSVGEYERMWMQEFPLYHGDDVYAALGGWHWPCADADWHELIDDRLVVMTFKDAEPWVEAWLTRDGQLRVIQRIT
jgi:hypothetical protein